MDELWARVGFLSWIVPVVPRGRSRGGLFAVRGPESCWESVWRKSEAGPFYWKWSILNAVRVTFVWPRWTMHTLALMVLDAFHLLPQIPLGILWVQFWHRLHFEFSAENDHDAVQVKSGILRSHGSRDVQSGVLHASALMQQFFWGWRQIQTLSTS